METNNSLLTNHIESFEGSDFITRIIKFEHLTSMIIDEKLKFPKIATWDDTYENFLFKSSFNVGGNNLGNIFNKFNFKDRYFGLCWSYWEETDALWRIYSPNNDRVKITINVGKLYDLIIDFFMNQEEQEIIPGIGRIVYINKKDWDVIFAHELFIDPTTFLTHNVLFTKRMEFEYENEFRTLFVSLRPKHDTNFIEIPISPLDLIEEIVFDPRISNDLFINYSNQLNNLGFNNYSKSVLYEDVNFEIKHDLKKLSIPPLKVINYYDRSNSLRLSSDEAFESLFISTMNQINEKKRK